MTGRVLFDLVDEDAPIAWQRIDADGHPGDSGTLGIGDTFAEQSDQYHVVAVPGTDVTIRWLELAATTGAQARAAARFALADQLAATSTGLHLAVDEDTEETLRLVAAVDAERMRRWLQRLAANGIRPDVLIPSPLLLRAPSDGLVTAPRGTDVDVRGVREAFTASPDMLALIRGDRAERQLAPTEAERVRLDASEMPLVNLLQGDFAASREAADPARLRRLAGWLAAAALLFLVAILVDGLRHRQAADEARAEIAALAEASGIPVAGPDTAIQSLRIAAAERGVGGGMQAATSALFVAVRSAPGITIETLEWRGGRLSASLAIAAGSSADLLRPSIEAAGFRLVTGAAEGTGSGTRQSVEIVP